MSEPHADLREEAPRVLDAVGERGIAAAALGGLAVHLRCPSARQPPLEREYKDLDLVARRSETGELSACLTELGYAGDEEFNALHGRRRLLFWDTRHERQLDVFVDEMVMCHTLDLRDRIRPGERTLDPADLLLAKLQVVEVNEKDLKDAAALLADHAIDEDGGLDAGRIAGLFAGDWGWWRTGTGTLERVAAYAQELDGLESATTARVRERARELRERIDAEPKSRRWRMRSKVGERVRWYELPEEVGG
jgi:hypothetical protein